MTKQASPAGEAGRLRRHTEDLAALAALPVVRAGADREQVARSLADTLLEMLDLQFVYLVAGDCETVRTCWGDADNGLLVNLRPLLAPWLRPDADPTGLLPDPGGDGALHLARTPLGDKGKEGVILCASRQEDFPSEEARLLLQIAASHGAVVLDARAAEEALRRERDELADFVENATVALRRVGPDGTILWANQAELDLLGYTREEYVGRHIAEFHIDPGVIEDILRRLADHEELHDYEARLRCKDGSIRHVSISSNVCWKDGQFLHTRCFTRDITEERRAKEALAESEERLRHLVHALPAAVYTCDARGRITQYNEAALELWGREPVPGQDRWCGSQRIYRPDGTPLPLDECPMAVSLRQGQPLRGEEIVIERPDGTRRDVVAYPEPIRGPSGAILGAVNMLVDLTDRKGAERRLATEHAVTRALAEARSFDEAAPPVLEALRSTLGAELSALWLPDAAGRSLRCAALSTSEQPSSLEPFVEQTFALPFACGEGLPGRVWQTRRPAWISDVPADPNFPRASAATSAGLHSGVGFPILIGDEFFGVIEFFFGQQLAPDPAVLNMMAAIGSEIGQFIQRTRIEAQLARFKFITDHSVEALALLDRDARHVYVNQTHCRLHGYTAEELLNMGALDLNPSMNLEQFRQLFDASQAGEIAPYEAVHRRKDGSTFPVEIAQTGVRFGGVPYAFAAKRDITDRKRAEQALAENERIYRGIGEALDYGIWICDAGGRNVHVSQSFLDLVGLTQEECSEFGWADVLHPDDAGATLAAWQECARTGRFWEREHRFRGVDGQWHPVLARGVPIRDERGEIVCWAGLNLDIGNLKRTEQELELARAAAEAASRAKSEFLARMSHELRTPLNAVIGMSRMLQSKRFGDLTDKQAEYLHDIRVAGEHLLKMINDILDLSKVEAGRLELNPAPLLVSETVGETLSPLRAIAEAKRIHLAFQPPAGDGEVFHDKARFNQVLFNLLSNALKFTPEGGQVTVRCHWARAVARDPETAPLAEAAGLRIDVEDTGVGIPREDEGRVWESFQQLKVELPRPEEGTGLGLPLCRQLVQLMGGVIWLTSSPGQGSCFSFVLPLRQPSAPSSL
jgi:PAS domain S-box-containing protein